MIRKRLLDLVLALPAALLLLPLTAALALAVKLDSPGPALFRQQRVGRGGRPFTIYKLRTMVARAPELGPGLTAGGDPRITRLGRFLRRTKLDELPQLWNVLRGDMSLVGPRPEVPEYVARYPAELRDKVLSVRPGITADAALEFFDEESELQRAPDPEAWYLERILPRKLELYARYVDRWTLRGDLMTILRTAVAVVRPRSKRA